MLFHTLDFALFLALVWPAALLLRRTRQQNLLLLVASYFFYGWWEWRYVPLLMVSTGSTSSWRGPSRRRPTSRGAAGCSA